MKRFYKIVSVHRAEGGYGVQLDGKPVRTPSGQSFLCESEAVANALMAEWAAQQDEIKPGTMPMNQIIMTSIENSETREEIETSILNYAETDLLFYRSDNDLYAARQIAAWDPWLEWFEKKYGIAPSTTNRIESLKQPEGFAEVLSDYIARLDMLRLILFRIVMEETSSPLLTLAFFEKAARAEDLYNAVMVEDMLRAEIYLEDQYGAPPDQEKKRASIRANLDAAERMLELL